MEGGRIFLSKKYSNYLLKYQNLFLWKEIRNVSLFFITKIIIMYAAI